MSNIFNNIRFHFLYIDKYSFDKNWVFMESVVPYYMIRYVFEGEATFFIDKKEYKVKKGDVVYIPKGSTLSCYSISEKFVFSSIRFTSSVSLQNGDCLLNCHGMNNVHGMEKEKVYFEQMYEIVRSENPLKMFLVRGYLDLIIGSVFTLIYNNIKEQKNFDNCDEYIFYSDIKKEHSSQNDVRIQSVIDHIMLHPFDSYTIDTLAKIAGISNQRFCTLFKENTGKPPIVYINEFKIATAARMLLTSNKRVSEIAYELGYNDPNYFIREFKKNFGSSPNNYRKIAKE